MQEYKMLICHSCIVIIKMMIDVTVELSSLGASLL